MNLLGANGRPGNSEEEYCFRLSRLSGGDRRGHGGSRFGALAALPDVRCLEPLGVDRPPALQQYAAVPGYPHAVVRVRSSKRTTSAYEEASLIPAVLAWPAPARQREHLRPQRVPFAQPTPLGSGLRVGSVNKSKNPISKNSIFSYINASGREGTDNAHRYVGSKSSTKPSVTGIVFAVAALATIACTRLQPAYADFIENKRRPFLQPP